MQGFDTLAWLQMDHAGIVTQAKVEARLAEDAGFIDENWFGT